MAINPKGHEMKTKREHRPYHLVALGCFALSLMGLTLALAQNAPSDSKAACIGCSVDGKTTPRMADGHPDFNGFWGGAGGLANVTAKNADGSVLFDFAGGVVDSEGRTLSSIPEGGPAFDIGS